MSKWVNVEAFRETDAAEQPEEKQVVGVSNKGEGKIYRRGSFESELFVDEGQEYVIVRWHNPKSGQTITLGYWTPTQLDDLYKCLKEPLAL